MCGDDTTTEVKYFVWKWIGTSGEKHRTPAEPRDISHGITKGCPRPSHYRKRKLYEALISENELSPIAIADIFGAL